MQGGQRRLQHLQQPQEDLLIKVSELTDREEMAAREPP